MPARRIQRRHPLLTQMLSAPPGVSPPVWLGLLGLLAAGTALATWQVAITAGPAAHPIEMASTASLPSAGTFLLRREAEAATPARPHPTAPASSLPSTPDGESLSLVRARLAAAGPETPSREVDRWTERLASSPGHRAEMRRALGRMTRLQPLIGEALARERIPRDLLYLALIESSYAAGATSRVGAAGVWQFMPATARSYGLEVGPWVDERRDPVRATFAAARYLADLHEQFGDWYLAAAAYNAGSGRITRALRRATVRPGDPLRYWQIRPSLARETQDYVPKLLAAARIARNPAAFGFSRIAPAPALAFREVLVPGGTSLEQVARWAGAREDTLRTLNPHLVRHHTPPGRRWPVRLPLVTR